MWPSAPLLTHLPQGYSLVYARDASMFIGTFANFGMRNVQAAPRGVLPDIVFCFYQLMFAMVTIMIVMGGTFDRGRIVPSLVFSFIWLTLVYCPLACWTWNDNGWLHNLQSLDYAGGGPVHVASGWAAFAYALALGKRKHNDEYTRSRPHNTTLVFVGTCFVWFGWFGFNGGSALNGTVRSMYAVMNTQISAGCGALSWAIVDALTHRGRFSLIGACEGVIAGLVGITPAAGYVQVWAAALIGVVTAAVCNLGKDLPRVFHVDEGLVVFSLHALGGMTGSLMTGIFADSAISALDGVTVAPGAWNGNGMQVVYQLIDIAASSAWSFFVTLAILLVMKYIPGLQLRVSDAEEMKGLDLVEFHEEQIGDWSFYAVWERNNNNTSLQRLPPTNNSNTLHSRASSTRLGHGYGNSGNSHNSHINGPEHYPKD